MKRALAAAAGIALIGTVAAADIPTLKGPMPLGITVDIFNNLIIQINAAVNSLQSQITSAVAGGMNRAASNATLPNALTNLGLGTSSSPAFGALSLGGALAYPNAPLSRITGSGGISGTTSGAGVAGTYRFNSDTDTVDATSAGGLYNVYIGHALGGAGLKGHRTTLQSFLSMTATTGNGAGNNKFYTAFGATAQASANDSGTNTVGAGNLFGSNPICQLLSGATYWNSCVGEEVDVAVKSGATKVYHKEGLKVVQLSDDLIQGTLEDFGYGLANQASGTAPGWNFGFQFGMSEGWWPMAATGTMIGTRPGFAGGPAYAAAHGVDFSSVTFSSDAFKSAGFLVDPTGIITGLTGSKIQDPAAVAGGVGGQLLLQGNNTTPAQVTYAAIKASAVSGTPGAEAGSLLLQTMSGGAIVTQGTLTNAGALTITGNINGQGGLSNNGKLIASPTAPTIASGGCTTGSAQSISASNGSAAFQITLGGATCGSTITLTMPAAATDWVCDAHNITTPASNVLDVTGAISTTTVVLTNYVRTTGIAGNFTGAEKIRVKCTPY